MVWNIGQTINFNISYTPEFNMKCNSFYNSTSTVIQAALCSTVHVSKVRSNCFWTALRVVVFHSAKSSQSKPTVNRALGKPYPKSIHFEIVNFPFFPRLSTFPTVWGGPLSFKIVPVPHVSLIDTYWQFSCHQRHGVHKYCLQSSSR